MKTDKKFYLQAVMVSIIGTFVAGCLVASAFQIQQIALVILGLTFFMACVGLALEAGERYKKIIADERKQCELDARYPVFTLRPVVPHAPAIYENEVERS